MTAGPSTIRRRHRRWALSSAVLALAVVAASGCTGGDARPVEPFVLNSVANVAQVAQLTGPDSINHTDRFDVAGQDLGSMFEADGRTWFVFGDTFGEREPGLTGGGGTRWRSNAMAWSTDTDPTDGIRLDGYLLDEQGGAAEVLPSEKIDQREMTVIPTYGFAANGAMYLAFMSVRHWGDPGEWETNFAGLARSRDQGRTWVKLDHPRWSGDSNFVQVSVVNRDGDLYFWGVTHGRFGGVRLMKVAEADVEKQGAYRYFAGTDDDGRPRWSADEAAATTIVQDTVGELSVVWNSYLSRWLMTYSNGGSTDVSIREGVNPWGPWGAEIPLVTQEAVPGLYAPYQSPISGTDGGATIYFTLSVWGPYNVYWFKADLVSTR
ncbi:carbohydrate-binding protein [Plantactinospora sp. KBS50]|nr:carbohydrate-binding protein [Plantactinospora sp. KBS50]